MPEAGARPVAVVTGASRGIGAVYADRLARRGFDPVLVARDHARLQALAEHLNTTTGCQATVEVADLTRDDDIARVSERIEHDPRVELLVNNAGLGSPGLLAISPRDATDALLQLNIVALTRLSRAAARGFGLRRRGTIVNIGSAFALHLAAGCAAYAGSKAYVLHFSRALQLELSKRDVFVQAVLPGAVATDIWASNGIDPDSLPAGTVMTTEDLVDAALAGLDHGEHVTIPSLPDAADWEAFESAREALLPNLSREQVPARYRADGGG
ncbi:SDR family oxidoreductase [Luteimonas vadosa]|uniref:SDR family oxidoreductase n=1 Tax=Luteimonas vadosa TaxID=1165507 RepID=A0ABP9DWX0_9GAMM